jgi:cytochrome c
MKKHFLFFSMVLMLFFAAVSCGQKQEKTTQEDPDADAIEAPAPSSDELIAEGKKLVDEGDCKACHHPINKVVGPSHTDVAKKYEFTDANVKMLAQKIIKGGKGNWGDVIVMNPHPDLSPEKAEKMARYVLSLDGEKEH